MEKVYFEALKKLPDLYVDRGTKISLVDRNTVIAMHYQFGPIMYTSKTGEWKKLPTDNRRNIYADSGIETFEE
jgi:hypothetical protein